MRWETGKTECSLRKFQGSFFFFFFKQNGFLVSCFCSSVVIHLQIRDLQAGERFNMEHEGMIQ